MNNSQEILDKLQSIVNDDASTIEIRLGNVCTMLLARIEKLEGVLYATANDLSQHLNE